jgi:hypothetical protein
LKTTINFSFILSGALLLSMLCFSQVKTNRSATQSNKEVKMEKQNQDSLQFSFIENFFLKIQSTSLKKE